MASKFCFNTFVSDILCTVQDNWIVEFNDLTTKEFTFVIVCNGLVSFKPNHIILPGTETVKNNGGIIMHLSQHRSDDILLNKRILVIGNGKSAVDATTAAAKVSKANPGDGMKPPILVCF